MADLTPSELLATLSLKVTTISLELDAEPDQIAELGLEIVQIKNDAYSSGLKTGLLIGVVAVMFSFCAGVVGGIFLTPLIAFMNR